MDLLGFARYEYDSKGFHIHDGWVSKLTYGLKFNDDGSITPEAVKGHEKEFDLKKAKASLKKILCDPKEVKKMRDEYAKAWATLKEGGPGRETLAKDARKLRKFKNGEGSSFGNFKSSGGALVGIALGAIMINPANGETKELVGSLKNIQRYLENGDSPHEGDIGIAMSAMEQIGGDYAAFMLIAKLDKLEPACCPEEDDDSEEDE